ncbi:MAG: AAA family ATPase [Bryobacterales bacterium]|nr:AAA family ATPase [Bryobacterales bacterium]
MPPSNRTATPSPAGAGSQGRGDAWLLSSDRKITAELLALLAKESPTLRVRHLEKPPVREPGNLEQAQQLPCVCFVHAQSAARERLEWISRLSAAPLNVPTVALLENGDPEAALRCLRKGACGCLIRPFDSEQLLPLLLRVGYHEAAGEEDTRRKVVCVVPAKGSSGATTLAVSLACHAAKTGQQRVLLADLDPLAGTLAFTLKLKSPYSFADALSHAEQLDADLWRGLICTYRGLDVLLAPEEPLISEAGPAVPQLLSYARRAYDLVVLDTGGPFTTLGMALARLSDEVLAVTTSELGAVHGAKRTLAHLAANGVPQTKIKLVISRWRKDLGFDRDEVETALGLSVFHLLPNDSPAVEAALLEGRPVAPGSNFGKSLSELAMRVLNPDVRASRESPARARRALLTLGI